MTSIKKTGPKPQPTTTARRNVASCGPATPTERAASSCGGWVSKATRGKADKSRKADSTVGCGWTAPQRKPTTVSSCGGAGWSRWGKIPSGC